MKATRQFRIFLALTGLLALVFAAWGWVRWKGQAPERAAWTAIQSDLGTQSVRIDSLKRALASMDIELDRAKRDLTAAGERLGHWERQAVGGRLPAPQHRQYLRDIDRYNEAVDAHTERLGVMQGTYAEYSALVDTHNVLVDSANALQRRAVQEGIQLAAPD